MTIPTSKLFSESPTPRGYRRSVVGVFYNDQHKVLVLERIDTPHAWQFPQGGIEHGESPREALLREMTEELGNSDIICTHEAETEVSYDFPSSLRHTAIGQRYIGQSLRWFLCRFGSGGPDLHKATHKEFRDFRWVDSSEVLGGTVSWKLKAYEQGMNLLGLSSS